MPKALLEFAPRSAIDMTLSRFVQQGTLRRAGRGLYARPEKSEWTGENVPVELEAALNTITQHLGETIAPHGAIAVNRFNLSTQIPMRPIFLTTGRSRILEIEGREVELKHVNPRQLPLGASRPGVALIAMRYLGREHLEPQHIRQIREQLSTEEWAQLKSALIGQPAWLIEAIGRNEGQYV